MRQSFVGEVTKKAMHRLGFDGRGAAMSESAAGRKNDRMMAGDKERGQRLETLAAEWTRISRERGNPAGPGVTFARMVSERLQMLYPAADRGDESEALRRLMVQLAGKDL